jgi:hypothetical protein
MSNELRAGLDREAKLAGRSLSQEVEHRLRGSLDFPARFLEQWGGDHHYSLGRLLARAAQGIELVTGKRWLDDAFAAQALRAAISIILTRMIPDVPAETPARVKQSASTFPPELAAAQITPEGVGASIAYGLIEGLNLADPPEYGHPAHVHYSDYFHVLPKIREGLGLKKRDKS